MRPAALLACFILAGAGPDRLAVAHAQVGSPVDALPVERLVLENGMRILVLPRQGAPTVAFAVRYGVGSIHESLGQTGIAHLLEHMLFKGTTTIGTRDPERERALFRAMDAVHDSILAERGRSRRPDERRLAALSSRLRALEDSARSYVEPNELDRILTRNGARGLNATTSTEATTYFVELPANRAELWFALEADRMQNPVFREFYSEREVVAEERRIRIDTDPFGMLHALLLATAFQVHPYGVPVIGHMSDIEKLTRAQVASYFERYYGARNVVLAIAGDVDRDSIAGWAARYLGPVRPGEAPARPQVREPVQRGERRVELRFDAEPRVAMAWHTVGPDHPDHAPLAVLAAVLAGGRTARLHRRLVMDERTAHTVSAGLAPGGRDPQLFLINAAPRAPHTTAELETAIAEELAALAMAPPAPEELLRVRNQLEAGEVHRLRSTLGLALQLAEAEGGAGDWREAFRFTERLRAVTAEDVRRVAATYFRSESRTVATLVRTAAGAAEDRSDVADDGRWPCDGS